MGIRMEHSIVSYGDDPLQQLKFFRHHESNDRTILFIHGGAWRDPNNTFDDFEDMVNQIKKNSKSSSINLVGINYRLSPEVKHPIHLWDILQGIEYLANEYGIHELLIVGHSVGATLIMQLLSYEKILEDGCRICQEDISTKDYVNARIAHFPTEEQLKRLKRSLDTIRLGTLYFIDGIYDMVELIIEYGDSYKSFVDQAFTSTKSYTEASQLTSTTMSSDKIPCFNRQENGANNLVKFVVVHSLQDELLSLNQANLFRQFFSKNNIPSKLFTGEWGQHEEVYRRQEVTQIIVDNL